MGGDHEVSDAYRRLESGVFIGRAHDLDALRAHLDNAQAGRGGVVLICGEPGAGKTSLVQKLLADPIASEFNVLMHTCAVEHRAFWPWSALLEHLKEEGGPRVSRLGLDGVASLLAQPAEQHDAVRERSLRGLVAKEELYDRVLRVFRSAARTKPILLVLDELHAADPDSVRLLRYCSQQLTPTRVLILTTYRQHELGEAALQLTEEIAQRWPGRRLTLNGLAESEVRELVGTIAGSTCAFSLSHELYRRTEGNPLYIKELLRHLLSEKVLQHDGLRWTIRQNPAHVSLPSSLEETIWQRLKWITETGRRVLNCISVVSASFDLTLVRRLSGLSQPTIVGALEEASTKHIIRPESNGYFRFTHPLFREVLHSRLPHSTRSKLHLQLGAMLEQQYGDDADQHASELLYHFSEALSEGNAGKVIHYARRAAEESMKLMAYDEAARLLESAVRALDRTSTRCLKECEVLLFWADALWRSGAFDRARQVSLRAIEFARRRRSSVLLARAVLSYAGPLEGFGAVEANQTLVTLLREALRKLKGLHPLRPLLMARMAEELAFSESDEMGRSLGRQAIQAARALGDPAVLAATLKTVHWAIWTPENVQDRMDLADEIVELANETRDDHMGFDGELVRVWAFFELGDRAGAEAALRNCRDRAEKLREPYKDWLLAIADAFFALMVGHLDRVEPLAQKALRLGQLIDDPNCQLFFKGQMAHLSWVTGRFEELARYSSEITAPHPLLKPTVSCARASMLCEMGRIAEARAEFERWARDDFRSVPRNPAWLVTMSIWARVCAVLGDSERAETLYRLLQPFDGRNSVFVPFFTSGAAAYYLGLLAATMGRFHVAQEHYEKALSMNLSMGTVQWVARTQVAYASMLLRRQAPGDAERARLMLVEAKRTSEALGMPTVVEQARIRLESLLPTGSVSGSVSAGHRRGVFRRDGAYRIVEYKGEVRRLRNFKCFGYLAPLLAQPGTLVSATELRRLSDGLDPDVSPVSEDSLENELHPDTASHADRILDKAAQQQLRQRCHQLRAEEDVANAANRSDEAARVREEREQIEDELLRVTRPGGKARHFPSRDDRDRQAARKGIVSSLKHLDAEFPDLADHLRPRVETGRSCIYQPDPRTPIKWEV